MYDVVLLVEVDIVRNRSRNERLDARPRTVFENYGPAQFSRIVSQRPRHVLVKFDLVGMLVMVELRARFVGSD
jgi:hypothetical protein